MTAISPSAMKLIGTVGKLPSATVVVVFQIV